MPRLRSHQAAPPPRGVLVTPRTLSGGHRERARGLALSRPSPLWSQPVLRLRLGDPALLPSPPRAPTVTGARAQRRAAERGREGRAGVRACVSLRQRARRRERARGKGGFGRGASASFGYVAELLGSGYSFAAIAASSRGVSAPERDCPHARRAPSTAELAGSPVGASRPSSPEGGGEAILSRPTPRNRAERLGRGCGAAVAALGGTERRRRRCFLDEAARRSPAPSRALLFPRFPGPLA